MIQDVYQESYHNTLQPIITDKEKQKEEVVQDKGIFLHKPYDILSNPAPQQSQNLILYKKKSTI